uniref:Hexosyltransferase n=1 Tax=Anopheles coluzzii TaxID=1518534 RepID=A0A8W7PAQ8_ANOCL
MGAIDKLALGSVVISIASVCGILICLVQISNRMDDSVNQANSELLQKIALLRVEMEQAEQASPSDPLLSIVIRSAKQSTTLRRTIRHTWAQNDHRVVHRFELHAPTVHPKAHPTNATNGSAADWLKRLQHHHRAATASNARYLLIVNEYVFVNMPLLLETIERILPRQGFILCKPVPDVPAQNGTCDPAQPILLSMDVARGLTEQYVVQDGSRLYLNDRETEAFVRDQMDDEGRLTFFFTASLLRFTAKMPLTQRIEQLWLSLIGNYTPVEY